MIPNFWAEDRYEPRQLEPDGRGRRLWVLLDHHNGGVPVTDVDLDGRETAIPFPTDREATEWVERLKYTSEGPAHVRRV